MDTCVRNLTFVHHMASLNTMDGRTEMNDKGRFRAGHQAEVYEDELICPKPRRMGLSCCAPELIKPLYHLQRTSSRLLECEAGYEILEIFLNKGMNSDEESSSLGCSPPTYCSPPSRASNPIVHDVQFLAQRASPILFGSTSSSDPKAISGSSFSSSPRVRIEGFDCSMRENARCDVRAYA